MIWFVFFLGLFVGFLVGVVLDDALNLYRSSRKDRPVSTPDKRRRPSGLLTVGLIAAMIMLIGSSVLLIVQRQAYVDYVACKAAYDQQAAESSSARLQVAEDVDSAMDDLIKAVATEDRQGFKDALAAYLDLRETQQRQRTNLPPAPESVCGEAEDATR